MNVSTNATPTALAPDPPAPHAVSSGKHTVDVIARWLATAAVVACALQIAFAALGFWGAEEHPGDEAAGKAAFAPHAVNGYVLGALAVLLLVAGLITMADKKSWIVPLVLAVLIFVVQGMLVGLAFDHSRWFGGLHALIGTGICAGFAWLAYDRWQHRLPSHRAVRR